jgi:hypothetical protein
VPRTRNPRSFQKRVRLGASHTRAISMEIPWKFLVKLGETVCMRGISVGFPWKFHRHFHHVGCLLCPFCLGCATEEPAFGVSAVFARLPCECSVMYENEKSGVNPDVYTGGNPVSVCGQHERISTVWPQSRYSAHNLTLISSKGIPKHFLLLW